MRHRLRNVSESSDSQAVRLIGSKDLLSTLEQEQVLKYLAGCLKLNVAFLRALAVLQLFISSLYVCMLVSGNPLVFTVFHYSMEEAVLPRASVLTASGTAAILASALLLALGGLGDLRVCRRSLYVSPETFFTVNGDAEKGNPQAVGKPVTTAPCHQYVLGFFALWPSVYWLYVMHAYHVHLAHDWRQSLFGVADNWMEPVLVLWQPVMHMVLGKAIASVMSGKESLLDLARLKYPCEKI